MKKLTREQILDLRNSFGVWQQDYDSVHDKEQHDMFALAVVAMDEMLAAMDGEDAERREWMARGAEKAAELINIAADEFPESVSDIVSECSGIASNTANKIRAGEVSCD